MCLLTVDARTFDGLCPVVTLSLACLREQKVFILSFLHCTFVRPGDGRGAENTPVKEAGLTQNSIGSRDSDVRDSDGGVSVKIVGELSMMGLSFGDVKGEEGGNMLEASVGHSGWHPQLIAAATSHGKSKLEALGEGVIF